MCAAFTRNDGKVAQWALQNLQKGSVGSNLPQREDSTAGNGGKNGRDQTVCKLDEPQSQFQHQLG